MHDRLKKRREKSDLYLIKRCNMSNRTLTLGFVSIVKMLHALIDKCL